LCRKAYKTGFRQEFTLTESQVVTRTLVGRRSTKKNDTQLVISIGQTKKNTLLKTTRAIRFASDDSLFTPALLAVRFTVMKICRYKQMIDRYITKPKPSTKRVKRTPSVNLSCILIGTHNNDAE